MLTLIILIMLFTVAVIIFLFWAIYSVVVSLNAIAKELKKMNQMLAIKNRYPDFDD